MASIWKVLGLDGPTADLKAIKRAYAKKLKLTRPEDDPAAFMALRSALDQAKNYARYNAPQVETPENEANAGHAVDMDIHVEPITSAPLAPPTQPAPSLEIVPPTAAAPDRVETDLSAAKLMTEVNALIDEASHKNDAARWKNILTQVDNLSITEYGWFENRLCDRLLVSYDYYNQDESEKKPRFSKPKRPLDVQTLKVIFRELGWNKETYRPDHLREPLKWLIHEGGILKPVKTEKIVEDTWQRDLVKVGWRVAVIAIFSLTAFFTSPSHTAPETEPTLLPASGSSIFGTYETDREAGQYTYKVNSADPDISALAPLQTIKDVFEVQFEKGQTQMVTATITAMPSGPPTVELSSKVKRVPGSQASDIHNASFLGVVIFGFYCLFFLVSMAFKYFYIFFSFIVRRLKSLFKKKLDA